MLETLLLEIPYYAPGSGYIADNNYSKLLAREDPGLRDANLLLPNQYFPLIPLYDKCGLCFLMLRQPALPCF